jgi:hypothetical protein
MKACGEYPSIPGRLSGETGITEFFIIDRMIYF